VAGADVAVVTATAFRPPAPNAFDLGSSVNPWRDAFVQTFRGALVGNVTGNLTGDSSGTHTGPVSGNLTGNSNGTHTGNVTGDVTGAASENLLKVGGTLTGDLTISTSNPDLFVQNTGAPANLKRVRVHCNSSGAITIGGVTDADASSRAFLIQPDGSAAYVGGPFTAPNLPDGVGQRFTSAELTIPTTNGTISAAHGFSTAPQSCEAVWRCKAAEHGWAIGDELRATQLASITDRNIQYSANATNLMLTYVTTGGATPAILNKATGSVAALTAASWRLVLRGVW
jgi:outer membrane lipoprotein SlyB